MEPHELRLCIIHPKPLTSVMRHIVWRPVKRETRGPECDNGAYEVTDYADVRVELDIIQSPPYVSGQVNANITVTNQGQSCQCDTSYCY
ncbi:MAG: hypothetical protein R3F25_09265 [Gammaproteobacteria bacterium]